jgi:thymidylate kinase
MSVIVGLEAHDGTGKSSTAGALARLFLGDVVFVSKRFSAERKEFIRQKNAGEIDLEQLDVKMTQSYKQEKVEVMNKVSSDNRQLTILDRTWASHAAEQFLECRENETPFMHYLKESFFYPDGVIKPTITFELKIPEEVRQKRVAERGEDLTARDIRLNEDHAYRHALEETRNNLGCVRLRMRERNVEVAALRAAQALLGHKDIPPLYVYLGTEDTYSSN